MARDEFDLTRAEADEPHNQRLIDRSDIQELPAPKSERRGRAVKKTEEVG
jgi:hypothetical protein